MDQAAAKSRGRTRRRIELTLRPRTVVRALAGPVHAIEAEFLNVEVTDSHGHKPTFVPWFGALAHAIFFRKGTLDYLHTHICAPNAPNCGVPPGVAASRISGSLTAPGKLTIGVVLPAPGT